MSALRTVRVVISGRVQGVWYRAWTTRKARKLNLAGWVRNCADGTVEALFHGADGNVSDMLRACLKGPPAARVATIDEFPTSAPEGVDFRQLPDG